MAINITLMGNSCMKNYEVFPIAITGIWHNGESVQHTVRMLFTCQDVKIGKKYQRNYLELAFQICCMLDQKEKEEH